MGGVNSQCFIKYGENTHNNSSFKSQKTAYRFTAWVGEDIEMKHTIFTVCRCIVLLHCTNIWHT